MTRTRSVRTILLAAASVASLGLAGGASAQGWHGQHDGSFLAVMRGADRSAGQRQQVHAIMRTTFQQNAATRQQLRAVSEQIDAALLSSGAVSAGSLAPLLAQQERLRTTLDQARLSAALSIRQLLTTDQLASASAVHQQLAALREQERQVTATAARAE